MTPEDLDMFISTFTEPVVLADGWVLEAGPLEVGYAIPDASGRWQFSGFTVVDGVVAPVDPDYDDESVWFEMDVAVAYDRAAAGNRRAVRQIERVNAAKRPDPTAILDQPEAD